MKRFRFNDVGVRTLTAAPASDDSAPFTEELARQVILVTDHEAPRYLSSDEKREVRQHMNATAFSEEIINGEWWGNMLPVAPLEVVLGSGDQPIMVPVSHVEEVQDDG